MSEPLAYVQDPAFCRQELLDISVAIDPVTSKIFVVFSEVDQTIRLTPTERAALQGAVLRARTDRGISAEMQGIQWMSDFCAYVAPCEDAPGFRRDVFANGVITYFDNVKGHGRLRLVHCYCASACEPYECRLAQTRLREARATHN